jgi:restriction system protein
MAQHRTLFSVLLAQPWWISALVGVAMFGLAQLTFAPVAPWVALPFIVIAAVVGWKQLRSVSPGQVEDRLKVLREMSWEQFSQVLTDAYRRQGYEVAAAQSKAYDYTLTRNERITLLQCRRWKVNQMGVAPLQDLAKAIHTTDAANGICITTGAVSPNAAGFAAANPVAIVSGKELAALIGKLAPTSDK